MSTAPARMPRQIPFIIANEGCERFSFYGMRNILTTFLAGAFFASLPQETAESEAKDAATLFANCHSLVAISNNPSTRPNVR